MLPKANQVTGRKQITRRLPRRSEAQARALRATCLLCRVLWPMVVQHRHLLFDSCSEEDSSSEAKTIFLQRKPSQAQGHASR
jgi:hypothetical protein